MNTLAHVFTALWSYEVIRSRMHIHQWAVYSMSLCYVPNLEDIFEVSCSSINHLKMFHFLSQLQTSMYFIGNFIWLANTIKCRIVKLTNKSLKRKGDMKMYLLSVESPLQLVGNKKVIAKGKLFKFPFKVCSTPCREYSKDAEEVLKILDTPSSQWNMVVAA